jgi:hypothetical protein
MGKNHDKGNRGNRPKFSSSAKLTQAPAPINYDEQTPKFCLRHLHRDFNVKALTADKQADFALALQLRATMTWREIIMAPKHGLGAEHIPKGQIRAPIPRGFEDADQFLVLRYSGKLPMAGVRVQDVFHILWIEPEFGRLYDHG